MSSLKINDLLITDNSFYGITLSDYIDSIKDDVIINENYKLSEIRKAKAVEEILPLINKIYETTLKKKKKYETNKKSILNSLNDFREISTPVKNNVEHLLNIELKLIGIMSIGCQDVFSDKLDSIIIQNPNPLTSDNKHSEDILNTAMNYKLLKFNNTGEIISTFFDEHLEVFSQNYFDINWDKKSIIYSSLNNEERKYLLSIIQLIIKSISEIRHFSLYDISSKNFDEKTSNYSILKNNIKNFYKFVKDKQSSIIEKISSKLSNKQIVKEKLSKNTEFKFYSILSDFLEDIYIKEMYRKQLREMFESRKKNRKYNEQLKAYISYSVPIKKTYFSNDLSIKLKQEEVLSNVLNKDTNKIIELLLDNYKPSIQSINMFKALFTAKDYTQNLYGVSIEKIFIFINKFFSINTKEKYNIFELKKYQVFIGKYIEDKDFPEELKKALLKENPVIIKELLSLAIITKFINLIYQVEENNIFNSSICIQKIYDYISNEVKTSDYTNNIHFFSLFNILFNITKAIYNESNQLLSKEISQLSLKTPTKLITIMNKNSYNKEDLEELIVQFEDSIDEISKNLKSQKKYTNILNKIVNIVNNKIDNYTENIIKNDVQKKLGIYSNIKLNTQPRNKPQKEDWLWIISLIEIGEKQNYLPIGTTNNIIDFINNNFGLNPKQEQNIKKEDKSYDINTLNDDNSKKNPKNNNKFNTKKVRKILFNLMKSGYKKFKDFNKEEQDLILKDIIHSNDIQNTRILTFYGISSSDILSYVNRNYSKSDI
ncbi:MAG: hypothetical protein U0354_17970 [Candidatus Sericytochromatia bacterium]